MSKNSNEDELKREQRSLKSKIDRREAAILFAQQDIRKYRFRLLVIDERLAEYRRAMLR